MTLTTTAPLDSGEAVIERAQALAGDVTLTGNLSVAGYLSFVSSGATKLTGGGFQAVAATIDPGNRSWTRPSGPLSAQSALALRIGAQPCRQPAATAPGTF